VVGQGEKLAELLKVDAHLLHPGVGENFHHLRLRVRDFDLDFERFEFACDEFAAVSLAQAVEFKGKWYLYYHDSSLSGGQTHLRCVKVAELKYKADGTIEKAVAYK